MTNYKIYYNGRIQVYLKPWEQNLIIEMSKKLQISKDQAAKQLLIWTAKNLELTNENTLKRKTITTGTHTTEQTVYYNKNGTTIKHKTNWF